MPWKVIEFQDPTGEIMVARVPGEGTGEFVSGTQLIVQEGQIAAFFHDGKPTDGFRAGRYNLTTQNLPILGKLLKLATLGGSPFRSYVYFVALKTFTNLGWGTPTPVLFRDTEFRMLTLRAHGTFAIRISDPKVFLHTIVGTKGIQTTFDLQDYLRSIIVSKLAQIVAEVMKSVVDLPRHYEQISTRVKQAVRDDFGQYGLELVDLMIEAITPSQRVTDTVDQGAGARSVTDEEARRAESMARAEALRGAAGSPAGAVAQGLAAGVGAGAGLGMARDMLNQGAASPPPRQTQGDEGPGG